MAWVYLLFAGLFEIGWAIGLKYTEGFTRLWPTVLTARRWSLASSCSAWVRDAAGRDGVRRLDRDRRGGYGDPRRRAARGAGDLRSAGVCRADRRRHRRAEAHRLLTVPFGARSVSEGLDSEKTLADASGSDGPFAPGSSPCSASCLAWSARLRRAAHRRRAERRRHPRRRPRLRRREVPQPGREDRHAAPRPARRRRAWRSPTPTRRRPSARRPATASSPAATAGGRSSERRARRAEPAADRAGPAHRRLAAEASTATTPPASASGTSAWTGARSPAGSRRARHRAREQVGNVDYTKPIANGPNCVGFD